MQDVIRKDHEYVHIQHTYLVASIDDDMRSAEEVGDCTGVGVEETLAGDGDTVSAPIDLHELGQRALQRNETRACVKRGAQNVHWDP